MSPFDVGPDDLHPTTPITGEMVVLERIRWGMTRYLRQHDIRAAVTTERLAGERAGQWALRVVGDVLTDKLPPQIIRRNVTITAEAYRYATWWDMCRDTYRDRWWGGWAARRWPPRQVPVPVRGSELVEVTVRQHWSFPQPRREFPDELGPVYLQTWTV